VAYQVTEALGTVPRTAVAAQLDTLSKADRKALARLGIRLGVESVFMPALLKPPAQRLRGLLWAASRGEAPVPPPPPGRVSFPVPPVADPVAAAEEEARHRVLGFRLLAGRAVRADMLERFAATLRAALREAAGEAGCGSEGALVPATLPPMLGISGEETEAVCRALGFRTWRDEAGCTRFRAERGRRATRTGQRPETEAERRRRLARGRTRVADSPFAVLAGKARA
jgi:ATP-dependent RNA helicase SUPV3L1/SUV3